MCLIDSTDIGTWIFTNPYNLYTGTPAKGPFSQSWKWPNDIAGMLDLEK